MERIDQQWDANLVDMQEIQKENDGVKNILVVIDILSWYAWTRPLLSKTADSTNTAFKDIMDIDQHCGFALIKAVNLPNSNRLPITLSLKTNPKPTMRSGLSKHWRKWLPRKLFHANSVRYIDDLQALTKSYNDSYHSSIKMAPSQVNKSNEGVFAVCATLFSEA